MSIDLSLQAALVQVLEGLPDPANHYVVNAHYYEYEGRYCFITSLYFHQEAVWNLELQEDAIRCEVLLDRSAPDERSEIRVPYAVIWGIQQSTSHLFDDDSPQLYYNAEVLGRLTEIWREKQRSAAQANAESRLDGSTAEQADKD